MIDGNKLQIQTTLLLLENLSKNGLTQKSVGESV